MSTGDFEAVWTMDSTANEAADNRHGPDHREQEITTTAVDTATGENPVSAAINASSMTVEEIQMIASVLNAILLSWLLLAQIRTART